MTSLYPPSLWREQGRCEGGGKGGVREGGRERGTCEGGREGGRCEEGGRYEGEEMRGGERRWERVGRTPITMKGSSKYFER